MPRPSRLPTRLFSSPPLKPRSPFNSALSISAYAVYIAFLTVLTALGFAAVGAVIFWLRSNDRMALLLSLALVMYPAATDPVIVVGANQPWRWLVGFLTSFGLGATFIAFFLFP